MLKKAKKPAKRKATNKGAAKLKQITTAAKKLYKANPRKKWTSCVKEAAKKLR